VYMTPRLMTKTAVLATVPSLAAHITEKMASTILGDDIETITCVHDPATAKPA